MDKGEKSAKSAHAYTSGLKIKNKTKVQKLRRLPIQGEVVVKTGDKVEYNSMVAKTQVLGDPTIVVVASQLGCLPELIPDYIKLKEGEIVKKGEILAETGGIFGMFKSQCLAPCDGVLENISKITGQCILRGLPIPVEVEAYIPGEVIEVIPREGAVIETDAAFIQGIIGIGGETHGNLEVLAKSPADRLTDDLISKDAKGKIIVGGSSVTGQALKKAREVGANGVIAGSIDNQDLIDFLGYELGLAITGNEELDLTLVVTEGFGDMAMSQRAFDIIKKFDGYLASINGTTQIRAGVMRPEVIIPHKEGSEEETEDSLGGGMTKGTPVRIIREPFFGFIGQIEALPVELAVVESGSKVRVAQIKLENGEIVTVPRANLELIEE